jgi:5-methyltetrahydropteroyltriglutamate--homocysteine methyltransferase
VADLAAAGANLIQIDEPSLLKHPEDLPQAERSLKALSAAKGSSQLMLAVYFGDAAPFYDKLQALPVDALGLDFTYSPGLVEIVSARGSAKALALGLVDGRNTRLENPPTVAGQLEKIGRRLGSARAWLSPSCGFEYLPRDRAQLKLRHLRTIRQEFLGGAE